MKTKTSVLIGIGILLILGSTAFYFVIHFSPDFINNKAGNSILSDSVCDGEKNKYYDLGFGVEHSYEGYVATSTPDQKVHVVLSCDHTKFTITGAVSQIISSAQLKADGAFWSSAQSDLEKNYFTDTDELADLVGGTEVVSVDTDYNFDGYNDLSTIWGNGQGSEAIDSTFVFLFDPAKNQFVFNSDLSSLENLSVNSDTKQLVQTFNFNEDGGEQIFYKWGTDKKLYKATVEICESDRQFYSKGDEITSYVEEFIKYRPDGKIDSSTKKKLLVADGKEECLGNTTGI